MKKLILLIGLITYSIILVGCSGSSQPDPEEAIQDFINLWTKQDFESMQSFLTAEAKDQYPSNKFTEKYERIYHDLNVEKLNIEATALTKKELKAAHKHGKVSIRLAIDFKTTAGKMNFSREIPLRINETDDEAQWLLDWDEGFILPGLENGGKLVINRTEARRGEILDRNKMPLALNDVAYEIGVTPQDFVDETSEKQRISELLNMSVDKIDEHLSAPWVQPDYYVPLSIIPAHKEETLHALKDIPGITYEETLGRAYPLGEAAAHLTGYTGTITQEELKKYSAANYTDTDIIGKSGLEQMYEKQLRGEQGVEISILTESETGSEEKEILAEKLVQHGENIQLSIDANIQEKVHNAYDGRAGTSAVIQPKTGEVLALISSPGYNPIELTYGITESRWEQLMEDENKPFMNRFRSVYAPGSSIKPITAAVGLANDTIHFDEGIEINGLTWGKKSWNGKTVTRVSTSTQPVTLEDALKRSDNIYFAMKAVDMGAEKFIKGMKAFGFEKDVPFAFPIQSSRISNDDQLDEFLLANTSYGQGEIEMSSLHIALAYTPFLNDGDMLKPNFFQDDKKGEVWRKNLINEKQADQMKTYLREVVAEGTAKIANDEDLPISGKTGTVELKLSKHSSGQQNGWFVGYPTEEEDILVAMMIEDVGDVGSSSYAAEKVKDILIDIQD